MVEEKKKGLSKPLGCTFENTAVDEVGTLGSWNTIDDGNYIFRGIEKKGFGVFLLSAAAVTCTAPLGFLFMIFFHNKCFMINFASENPKVGGVTLPLVRQIPISNFILTFQILNKIVTFIRLLGFRFSYSLKDFWMPLCNLSLITLQMYEFSLKNTNFFKIICKKKTFSVSRLSGERKLPLLGMES